MTDTIFTLTADQTDAIHKAAFDVGRASIAHDMATVAALAAVQANGGVGQQAVRDAYYVGHMAGYMAKRGAGPTLKLLEEALIMRFAANASAKTVKEGEPQRSPAWEKAFTSARDAWRTLRNKAGVETTEKRGGARDRKITDETETSTDEADTPDAGDVKVTKPKAPTVPKVTDRKAANTWLARESAVLVAFVVHNADHVSADVAKLIERQRQELLAMLKD